MPTARKAGQCANAHAATVGNAPGCTQRIEPGDLFEYGENDPYYAGGFGRDRICKPCADAGRI